jgi:dihydropteroate synthase
MASVHLRLRDRVLDLSTRTLIMGILNVTPDSFSDGGLFLNAQEAVLHGIRMVEEGADILDVGGESTRPGSEPVSLEEESRRVLPVIEGLAKRVKVPLSIDTTKSQVAERALEAGAALVNDTSGLQDDPRISTVAAKNGAALVLMHRKGQPKVMQKDPRYDDLIGEIASFLKASARKAKEAGVGEDQIIIDPGLGFGKTLEHNVYILNHLEELSSLGMPVLVGPSRKSFIGKILDLPVEGRLEGTAAAVAAAVLKGAAVVRVHDVKEMVRVVRVADAIRRA